MNQKAPFIGVARHRMTVDGEGITTLAAFHACTLNCKYCLNPQSLRQEFKTTIYTPAELYELVKVDELYFLATNGGVCFGGGEPCLRYEFLNEFRTICGNSWKLTLETALNVPQRNVEALVPIIDHWIIDIKDTNPETYQAYTGRDNAQVMANLRFLSNIADKVYIRVPLIPDFNNKDDQEKSVELLKTMGFTNFDLFEYKTDINK